MWLKCSLCSKNCFLPYSRLFSSTLNFFEFPWRFELSGVDCIYSHNVSKVLLYLHGVCSCFLCGIFLIRSGLGISSTPKLKFTVSKVKYGQKPQRSWRIIFFSHNDRNEIGFSLRKHPFLLTLRRWGRFARNVPSCEERRETDVFAG